MLALSLVVLKDKIVIFAPDLGLEDQVLGLEAQVPPDHDLEMQWRPQHYRLVLHTSKRQSPPYSYQ